MVSKKKNNAYGLGSPLQDVFPSPVKAQRAPTTSDVGYEIGQVWVDQTTDQIYGMASVSSGSATWSIMGPGASDVDTLTGDSGGALSPAAGNITLAGGTNITTAGAASTITFNLDAAIILATSVTAPLYTAAAAADLDLTAPTGQDVVMKLGDAAGANKLSITDSSDVEVFAVDSNGALTFSSLVVTGAFTQTAGVVSISEDNSANAVGIANGTTARAVSIASSAAAHTIAIGSATGAASLDLKAGTGNYTLDGAGATTYTVGASTTTGTIDIGGTAQTGTMTLGDSSGVNIVQIGSGEGATTVNIAGGATAAKVVNVATGAVANLVTIGSASGAAALDLLAGTGNFTLDGAATTTYTVGAATTSGTISIGGTAQTGTMTLGDSSGVNIVQIGSGEGATTVNVAGGATAAKVVNIATGAVANVVTIGSATGAASLDLLAGTGNYTLNGAATTTYTVGAATTSGTIDIGGTAQTGTMTVGSSSGTSTLALGAGSGASTVAIAGGTGGNTVTVADGAGANAVTIGSTNTTSALTLQAGSGDITVTGTVKEINSEFLFSSGTDLTVTQSPIMQASADTGAAPTGTTGAVNLMSLQDGCLMEQFILGAGQTIIAPRMTANGLNIALDQVNTEGAEYNFGARNNAKHAYTIGTSAAFFMEATFYVTDYSGCAPLMMGFRKVEANNATLATYTDYAAIGINQATSAVNATILSELNAGGQTATDTTDALAAEPNSFVVKVLVSAAGVTTFEVDGSAASAAPSYTFDNTDVVMPFIHFLNGADLAGEVGLKTLKIGFQA